MKLEDYDLEGYVEGTPRHRGIIDGIAIDKEVSESYPCAVCGGQMQYRPFVNRSEDSYRAFAVCAQCGSAIEF